VKRRYLEFGLDGTVVTTRVDGMPHRVLRTELVNDLESAGRVRGVARAVANAARFRSLTGLSWSAMLREGYAMRHGRDLSWAQVLMAANTPMLLRAAMVGGRADTGVFASGQVVGMLDDLPGCAELIDGIVTQAAEILTRLAPVPSPLP
jgi:NAD(P)H-dependent flavin oxidoreductase YrpB (nitropropane dioxygenase family)